MHVRSHLDALLGTEGRRVTREELARFYRVQYLANNPTLDVSDAVEKAVPLLEACRRSGVTEARSLLEVGCGSGVLLGEMARQLGSRRVVGADYAPTIAQVAMGQGRISIVAADGLSLPFGRGTFDLAYFADVLEHVLEPERLLREVSRVARRVAFLVPMEAGLVASPLYALRRARGKHTNYEQYGHIWRWTRPQVERMLVRAGISVEPPVLRHAPARLEGMNRTGRLMERTRATIGRLSPSVAEALFGGVAYVAVGRGSA